MSKSLLACAIGRTESAVVRIKTSGHDGACVITASRTVALGAGDLEGKKQQRALKKLVSLTAEYKGEDLALCYCPEAYLPLNAYFPSRASVASCTEYCRIEAIHFLNRPEEYMHDHVPYAGSCETDDLEKNLVLFYRAEPFRTLSARFAENHPLHFCGSPLLPMIHRSRSEGMAAFLDLDTSHITLTVARNGRVEYFSCRSVRNGKEAEYFAIHELKNCNACMLCAVQTGGVLANRAMTMLLERETSCRIVPPGIPEGIEVKEKISSSCRTASASRAIETALMALGQM